MNDKVSSPTKPMNDYQPVEVNVLAQNPMLTLQQWNMSLKERRAPLICKPIPSKPTAEGLGIIVHHTITEETHADLIYSESRSSST
jgi:hypothetical protein